MAIMKLLIGLGNPGEKYKNNRHNAGFLMIENIMKLWNVGDELKYNSKFEGGFVKKNDLIFFEPMTFMNDSGRGVRKVKDFFEVENDRIYLFHDDLDIALGEYKIVWGRGPKVHNGVNSVIENLGSTEFWRVRIGVDNRIIYGDDAEIAGADYVLSNFRSNEMVIIDEVGKLIGKELVSLCG